MMVATVREIAAGEEHLAWEPLHSLRANTPRAQSIPVLCERILQQRANGYHLWGVSVAGTESAVCVAGYRYLKTLAWGDIMYVDDLATHPDHRKRGHAEMLFNKLAEIAKEAGCDELHLDSGHHRFDAHRFYLNRKMKITSHHFAMELE
jgi:GNAT superfamily N-acetyltransferase